MTQTWLYTIVDLVVSLARAGMYSSAAFLLFEIAMRLQ